MQKKILTTKELIKMRMVCNGKLSDVVGRSEYEFTFEPLLDDLYKSNKKVYQLLISMLSENNVNRDLFDASVELVTIMAAVQRAAKP